jgi:A/G-specific adenine glycosylase
MFANKIINWYQINKRELPWRNTQNPYFIWLSEIILQQTRVAQGLPYYNNFVEKYPTIKKMADADETEVLRTWQGLGYYSRARNMYFTAKYITNELNGEFPSNFNDLQKLKGIGRYTAAAIASFAFDERVPVVDGNVMRVLTRFYEIAEPIDKPKTQNTIFEIAQDLISKKSPALFNQAIMELGATVCTPKNPNCLSCPIVESCASFMNKSWANFPFKAGKTKVTQREISYLVLYNKEGVFMKERPLGDIWSKLYDFPEFKVNEISSIENLIHELGFKSIGGIEKVQKKHILSHQKLNITFYKVKIEEEIKGNLDASFYDFSQVYAVPKPIVISNYIDDNL